MIGIRGVSLYAAHGGVWFYVAMKGCGGLTTTTTFSPLLLFLQKEVVGLWCMVWYGMVLYHTHHTR